MATEAAFELLSRCCRELSEFDNSGSYGEADLAHVVGRMQKVAGVLVPGSQLSAVLRSIDEALLVSVEERRADRLLGSVFPGPFLENRAKRLLRIAEALVDDIALGRLRHTAVAGPAESGQQGEPPPLTRWAIWCWENRRKHLSWVILTLAAAAVWFLLEIYPRLPVRR